MLGSKCAIIGRTISANDGGATNCDTFNYITTTTTTIFTRSTHKICSGDRAARTRTDAYTRRYIKQTAHTTHTHTPTHTRMNLQFICTLCTTTILFCIRTLRRSPFTHSRTPHITRPKRARSDFAFAFAIRCKYIALGICTQQ